MILALGEDAVRIEAGAVTAQENRFKTHFRILFRAPLISYMSPSLSSQYLARIYSKCSKMHELN